MVYSDLKEFFFYVDESYRYMFPCVALNTKIIVFCEGWCVKNPSDVSEGQLVNASDLKYNDLIKMSFNNDQRYPHNTITIQELRKYVQENPHVEGESIFSY